MIIGFQLYNCVIDFLVLYIYWFVGSVFIGFSYVIVLILLYVCVWFLVIKFAQLPSLVSSPPLPPYFQSIKVSLPQNERKYSIYIIMMYNIDVDQAWLITELIAYYKYMYISILYYCCQFMRVHVWVNVSLNLYPACNVGQAFFRFRSGLMINTV